MSETSEEAVHQSSPQLCRTPRFVGPAVFRFGIAGLFGIPLVMLLMAIVGAIHTDSASGPIIFVMGLFLGVLIGIPSLILGIGLLFRWRWAAWVAVTGDSVVSPMLLAILISGFSTVFVKPAFAGLVLPLAFLFAVLFGSDCYDPNRHEDLYFAIGIGILALAFLVDGIYVLRRLARGPAAWIALGAIAILVLMVGLVPVWQESQEVKPLISYVEAHFIGVPKGSRITVQNDDIHILTPDHRFISMSPERQGGGRWTLLRSPDPNKDRATLVAGTSDSQSHPPETADQAAKLVRAVGIKDPDLRPVGETKVFSGTRKAFCFWSPRADGTYIVPEGDGRVHLHLREKVEIR